MNSGRNKQNLFVESVFLLNYESKVQAPREWRHGAVQHQVQRENDGLGDLKF